MKKVVQYLIRDNDEWKFYHNKLLCKNMSKEVTPKKSTTDDYKWLLNVDLLASISC